VETSDFVILDGAMGTMLQAAGLPVGELTEIWNLTHTDTVAAIQRKYVEAGSDVLYANTFGANRYKVAKSGYTPAQLISGGIQAARLAAGDRDVKVALDVGPIGQLLEPLGTLSFDEAYDIYKEMVVAGEEAGADLVIFETMSDLYEVKAAVLAAKENTKLPVWVTMTFEATGRTFVGVTVPAMALTLTGLGVDALGFNCSLGPKELLPMVEELAHWTDLPIILKPNAGLPDPATGAYTITPAEFAEELAQAVDLGVTHFGGCCGTTPDFIAAVKQSLAGKSSISRQKPDRHGVCSATNVAQLNGVRVIGERINPTGKKRFQQALRDRDMGYILERGLEQQDAGADILDVNVGLPGIDETAMMTQVVKSLQSVVELPLQIDSSDPAAIEAGLRAYSGKPIVNSVNGNQEVLDTILPLCKKYGAAVVGLAMDHEGIPQTAQARIAIAERILKAALAHGIPKEDVYIDCLTLTVSAQQDQALETLKAVRYVTETLGLHTVLGVSNISFGLPAREHITVSFLTQAMYAGLDLPIVNPNQKAIMDAVTAYRVLAVQDQDSAAYIARFANAETAAAPAASTEMTIESAIGRGLKEETKALTEKALETMTELDVVNTLLIPALDLVGDRYEKQEIFLPQLINAANAACEGFEVIKTRIAQRGSGSVSKGKIVIATVQGDIHDIGKNIVRVVLENYGYTVIDLGRDVPIQTVVDAVIREDVKLVGLSALMTTTVVSMADTIAAIRASGHDCKIWVGGAVLTPEYAAEIGADYYAKDAKQSVDIARQVLG
jgi:5-methyltetrahydrofolate--homocysteine methyltransferase